MKKITIAIFLLFSNTLLAQAKRPGAVFLMIWPGAKPTSLGGAYTAISDDALATYYNVGGLAFINGANIAAQHVNWLPGLWPGMYYEYLAFATSYKRGAFGFNVIYLTTGKTRVEFEDGTQAEFATYDIALGVNYAHRINERIGVGGTIKYIYSFLAPEWVLSKIPGFENRKGGAGSSWALDLGIKYNILKTLSIGTTIQNIGPGITFVVGSSPDPLPLMLRVGYKWEAFRYKDSLFTLSLTTDFTKVLVSLFFIDENKTFSERLGEEFSSIWRSDGIELSYMKMFFFRLGYFIDSEGARGGVFVQQIDEVGIKHVDLWEYLLHRNKYEFKKLGFTIGGGFSVKNFSLDIGIDEFIYDFSTTNKKISVSYSFK